MCRSTAQLIEDDISGRTFDCDTALRAYTAVAQEKKVARSNNFSFPQLSSTLHAGGDEFILLHTVGSRRVDRVPSDRAGLALVQRIQRNHVLLAQLEIVHLGVRQDPFWPR